MLQCTSRVRLPRGFGLQAPFRKACAFPKAGLRLRTFAGNETSVNSSTTVVVEPPSPTDATAPAALTQLPLQQVFPVSQAQAQQQQDASDNTRVAGVIALTAALAFATELNQGWIADHQELAMGGVFALGYVSIIIEDLLGFSKAGVALMLGAALWGIRFTTGSGVEVELSESLGDVSQVIFFLMGAMTVVEVVDANQGFKLVTQALRPTSRTQLLLLVSSVTFFLSAILDNLTTTIVMVSLLQKLCPDPETRRLLGAVVVVAANAGGAWTPIGDVTTTMLWINGQITALPTMQTLLLPSLMSVAVPVAAWSVTAPEMSGPLHALPGGSSSSAALSGHSSSNGMSSIASSSIASSSSSSSSIGAGVGVGGTVPGSGGEVAALALSAQSLRPAGFSTDTDSSPSTSITHTQGHSHGVSTQSSNGSILQESEAISGRSKLVLSAGLGTLLFVPVIKATTGLPPYMGMLAGLGFLWLLTDALHYGEAHGDGHGQGQSMRVGSALKRIDTEGVLFFAGVLLAVAAMEKAGLLRQLAEGLSQVVPNQDMVAGLLGLASAVIDNVPLVAATMAMYDINSFPADDRLWQLIAYCAGTGGSLLIIGSAAGVAYMGMEEAKFGWYMRRITPWATVGYFAGIGTYLLQQQVTLPPI